LFPFVDASSVVPNVPADWSQARKVIESRFKPFTFEFG